MELREKIGQLFMLGFAGTTVSDELASLITRYRPGGAILFRRNLESPEQIVTLTNGLQVLSPESPLFISIDQEGGRVSRLPAGFTIFPPCAALGRCDSTELAYQAAAATAKELRAVGINMNMAPVLDVDTNPHNPIIGDRAFSRDPEQVARLGAAVMAGLHDHRVIACGKHFPGHGDTSTDSHVELPVVTAPAERLRAVELYPFRYAVERGLQTIMTAHVRYPALDAQVPATLSRPILTGLLRDELRFTGLILTDDLEMRAIVDHYGIGDAAVRAVQAGVDMLLVCEDRARAVEAMVALHRAVETGTIPESRIAASLQRIRLVKDRFLHPVTPADPTTASRIVGHPSHQALLASLRATDARRAKASV
jgi:beta-N-acetylhexosaminidase